MEMVFMESGVESRHAHALRWASAPVTRDVVAVLGSATAGVAPCLSLKTIFVLPQERQHGD